MDAEPHRPKTGTPSLDRYASAPFPVPLPRQDYRYPVAYQHAIVEEALTRLRRHRGAFVVASTGLGKTVIATDTARRLRRDGVVERLLLVAPNAVHREWGHHLDSARLPFVLHNVQALDAAASSSRAAAELDQRLDRLGQRDLLIVDECHLLRNRRAGGRERRAFRRWLPAVARAGCPVLLLTATPFSTRTANVNHQLLLLPHTAPSRALLDERDEHPRAWRVSRAEDLEQLPVTVIATTPRVAHSHGQRDERGVFVRFGRQRKYFPRVALHRVDTPVALGREVAAALAEGVFDAGHDRRIGPVDPQGAAIAGGRAAPSETTVTPQGVAVAGNPSAHAATRPPTADGSEPQPKPPRPVAGVDRHVRLGLTSSPWALREVLERTMATPGPGGYSRAKFQMLPAERNEHIRPLLSALDAIPFDRDPKLAHLLALLDTASETGDKCLVFCERLATVAYLRRALRALRPDLRVGATVEAAAGGYRQKPARRIRRLIDDFAPVPNGARVGRRGGYDVLITTDAWGLGVNLQDARVVISYDLAWTPIELAQRAGRVLRLWNEPRTVDIHGFVPLLGEDVTDYAWRRLWSVVRRWETLLTRHETARRLLDLPSLTRETRHEVALNDLAPAALAEAGITRLGELDLARLDVTTALGAAAD